MAPSPRESEGSSEEAASILRVAFGFDRVVLGERLLGGYANDLFRVTAHGGAFVLRLKHPPVMEAGIAWSIG